MSKLTHDFYRQEDVVQIASDLLGKQLVTNIDGKITSGIIVETEAYSGHRDKACHAYQNKKTKRTEIFFRNGGLAYVYLCYGIHHLFNIITGDESLADAVLIRAIEPIEGIDHMLERRQKVTVNRSLTGGPGSMSKALGITTSLNGTDLLGDLIWLEDAGFSPNEMDILASPRVGIDYAEEDALLPWRFRVGNSKWTSPAK